MALMLFKKSADQIKRDFNVYGETSEHHLVSNFIRNLLKELNINTISEFLTIVLKIKNEYLEDYAIGLYLNEEKFKKPIFKIDSGKYFKDCAF